MGTRGLRAASRRGNGLAVAIVAAIIATASAASAQTASTPSTDTSEPPEAAARAGQSSPRQPAPRRTAVRPRRVWTERIYVSANAAYQAGSATFGDSRSFPLHAETAHFESDYEVKSNTALDIGGAVRLWRGLGAGVAFTRFDDARDIALSATLPHPLFFTRDRSISGTAAGEREEAAVHVQAVFVVPFSSKLQAIFFGGPSRFTVKQSVVAAVNFTERFPFDEAAFSNATVETEEESKTGFNAGLDVGYYFARNLGIGGIVRVTRATVNFSLGEVDAGGVVAGGGVRVRF